MGKRKYKRIGFDTLKRVCQFRAPGYPAPPRQAICYNHPGLDTDGLCRFTNCPVWRRLKDVETEVE